MHRRQFLTITPVLALTGCASRSTRPSLDTITINSVGLLTVKEVPASSNVGPFNYALLNPTRTAGSVAPVSAATLGMGIGLALRASSDAAAAKARTDISAALQHVEFSPRTELQKAFHEATAKRSLSIKSIEDEAASERARTDWDFAGIPPGFDALLGLQIDYCGYFFEKEAGGFSPSLYATGVLLATGGGGARLERYYYQADYRQSEGDRRFITTSPTLTVSSLEQFRLKAPSLKEGMKLLFASVAERLAEDVDRTIKKLPKL